MEANPVTASQSSRQTTTSPKTNHQKQSKTDDQNQEPKEIYPWMTEYRAKGTIFTTILDLGKSDRDSCPICELCHLWLVGGDLVRFHFYPRITTFSEI